MSTFRRIGNLFRRIANLFRRTRIDREIDAELQAHISMRIEDNVAAGMSAEDARRDALVRFERKGSGFRVQKRRVAAFRGPLRPTIILRGFIGDTGWPGHAPAGYNGPTLSHPTDARGGYPLSAGTPLQKWAIRELFLRFGAGASETFVPPRSAA